MNRIAPSTRSFLLSLLLLPALAACSGDEQELKILPVVASVVTPAVGGDPVIFFQQSPADTNPTDDVVVVDVMLRTGALMTFDYINMEVLFDPGVIQVGQVDLSDTPLGNCTLGNGTTMLCASNANDANGSGDLIIGVSLVGGGTSAMVQGTDKLMTLRFIGATVGTSTLVFEESLTSGDCEILADASPEPVNLNVDCDGTGTLVTVAR